jgi:hypothetical protein
MVTNKTLAMAGFYKKMEKTMSKLRLANLFKSKNYIVITETINDGYVEPHYAEEFLEQLEPICENLKQMVREYTLAKSKPLKDKE